MIDGAEGFAGERVQRGDPAIVTSHRSSHLASGLPAYYVPSRKDMGNARLQVRVHGDPARTIESNARLFNGNSVRVGASAYGDQKFFRAHFADGIPHAYNGDHAAVLASDSMYRCARDNANTLLFKDRADRLTHFRLIAVSKQLLISL